MTTLEEVIEERVYLPTETLGSWYYKGECICKTMELPWLNNQHNISCIPENKEGYIVVKEETSLKHEYPHFRILGVPSPEHPNDPKKERTGILVHKITYVKDLRGCIGIGGSFVDLNKDGVPDIVESGKTLSKIYFILPSKFKLIIREKPKV